MASPVNTDVEVAPISHDANTMHDAVTKPPTPGSNEETDVETEEGQLTLDSAAHDDLTVGEDIVGFSISHVQDYLKSPKTPAVEKAKVLEGSHDYFAAAPESEVTDFDGGPSPPEENPTARLSSDVLATTHNGPSSGKAHEHSKKRSNTTKTILGQSLSLPRRRASSGPSGLGESIKRFLPDLSSFFPKNTPAVAGFGYGAYVREQESIEGLRRPEVSHEVSQIDQDEEQVVDVVRMQKSLVATPKSTSTSEDHSPAIPQERAKASQKDTRDLLSPTESNISGKVRRITSESSLYLRPIKTSSSAAFYDDTTVFADVSAQVNSRFKAIQDTWQDSTFSKMPKLPSVSLPKGHHFDWMKNESQSETSRENLREISPDAKVNAEGDSGVIDELELTKRAHPIIHRALTKMTGDVLVMGGYRGSILRSAEPPHRQLWVPVKVGLNMRKVDLEVGLTDEDEERMPEKIFASGILAHIGPVDISRRLLRHLRKSSNAKTGQLRVHDYGYDWRLSPELLSRHLIKYLEGLDCNKPDVPKQSRGAWVIAHSLGGLVARHAVNMRPELFAGVVFAGTPQSCVNILGPLRNGDDVLLSSRVLTAQTNFSFRTSYALLPEDGRCFIDKRTGERYDVDFFDAQTYDEYRLTPCINPSLPPVPRHQRKSLVGAMSSALADTITSTLPNRRSSWFGSSSQSPDISVAAEDAKNAVKDTARDVAHAGEHAGLEPSNMASNQHGKSLFSTSSDHSVKTHCTIPKPVAMEYLSRTLASVLRFKRALHFRPDHQEANMYPPFAFMFGKTVPTVYGARVDSREAIKRSDAYDDLAFAAGDGVVLASAAQLPKGYRCVRGGRVETDRGHVGLLGDLEAVGRALEAVVEARGKGVGVGHDQLKSKGSI